MQNSGSSLKRQTTWLPLMRDRSCRVNWPWVRICRKSRTGIRQTPARGRRRAVRFGAPRKTGLTTGGCGVLFFGRHGSMNRFAKNQSRILGIFFPLPWNRGCV